MKDRLVSLAGILTLLVVLILVNVLFSFVSIRWDLTEGKTYTLSEGTLKILGRLSTPVTVKFFFSRSNKDVSPPLKLHAMQVRELLVEYEEKSGSRLRLEEVDPAPDSDEEEWALRYGLQSIPGPSGDRIYCGLVFLCADQEASIDFVDPAKSEILEYEVTRILHRFESPEKKVVGILSGLPVMGGVEPVQPGGDQGVPWLFVSELRKSYEVKEIPVTSETLPSDLTLLMLVYPKDLNPRLQFAIDQYVLGKGRLLVFVDPLCISDRAQSAMQPMQARRSGMERLFEAWGIGMDPTMAVVDMDQPTRLRTGANQVEENPFWISARGESFNRSEIVTSQLESMLLPVAGSLVKAKDSPYSMTPLIQSSRRAALREARLANFGAQGIRGDVRPEDRPQAIAVEIRGKFRSAFPEGPPPEKDQGEKGPAASFLKEATEEAHVWVVADADLLADDFYVQKSRIMGLSLSKVFNDNLNFVVNACELLTGSDELIGLRTRGRYERPFTAVLEIQKEAQTKWRDKEQQLLRQVEETNRKLRELEQQKDSSQRLLVSPEQKAEIARFKEQKAQTNRELKAVRKNLRADIEALGMRLKLVNILGMALCVSAFGVLYAFYRQRRRRKR